jgi:hypothetical protein
MPLPIIVKLGRRYPKPDGKPLPQFTGIDVSFDSGLTAHTGSKLQYDDTAVGGSVGGYVYVDCCSLPSATMTLEAFGTDTGYGWKARPRVESLDEYGTILDYFPSGAGVQVFAVNTGSPELNCSLYVAASVNCARESLEFWAFTLMYAPVSGRSDFVAVVWFHGEAPLCDVASGYPTIAIDNLVPNASYYQPDDDFLIWDALYAIDPTAEGAAMNFQPAAHDGTATLTLRCDAATTSIDVTDCDLCTRSRCLSIWEGVIDKESQTWSGWTLATGITNPSCRAMTYDTDTWEPKWLGIYSAVIDATLPVDTVIYAYWLGVGDDCHFLYYKTSDELCDDFNGVFCTDTPTAPTAVPSNCAPCDSYVPHYSFMLSGLRDVAKRQGASKDREPLRAVGR